MAGGLGMMGYVGFGRENSGGVAVAPSYFFMALSESLTFNFERYELANIAGQLAEPDDRAGIGRVEGDISAVFDPPVAGHILRGAIGSASVTSLGGGLWRHDFSPPAVSQWDSRFAQAPFTFDIYRDVGSSQSYYGVNINRLELSLQPNQALQFTIGVLGIGMANRAASTASYYSLTPFTFDQASLTLGGAPDFDIESFTFTVDNALEGVPTLGGVNAIRKIRRSDFVKASLSMTLGFEDIVELNRFMNQTEVAMNIFMRSSGGSFALELDLPRLIYTSHPTGVGGRGRQTVTIDAKCRKSANYPFALKFTSAVGSY